MSFDAESYDPPSSRGGRDYEDRGESKFRIVPLVLTVIFGIAALVSTVMSFSIGTENLTADQESMKSTLLVVGIASFVGLIVFGRKVVKR